jgi:hypothetical protein
MQAEVRLSRSVKLRGGGGIYRQFPGYDEAVGLHAGSGLAHERAYHADLGVEQALGSTARWQVTFYNREERDVLRLPNSELRVEGDRLVGFLPTAPWINALDGYARGMEVLVQRRSANGVSGWVSYSLGFNRYHDRTTGESFDGDFDQRQRSTPMASFASPTDSAWWGSCGPGVTCLPSGTGTSRATHSSSVRPAIPCVCRCTRGSTSAPIKRSFNWESKRLTLFVEVMNVLGRDNVRYEQPGVNVRTRQAFGLFNSMIPLVPSAGVSIEF